MEGVNLCIQILSFLVLSEPALGLLEDSYLLVSISLLLYYIYRMRRRGEPSGDRGSVRQSNKLSY